MVTRSVIPVLIIISILSISCGSEGGHRPINLFQAKEALENVNKALVNRDRELIEAYIDRHQLEGVQENGAGLFYLVWDKPTGPQPQSGDIVIIDYTITLLDGTPCYSSDSLGQKDFLVGQGGVESGLEMGVTLMYQGQRARFILPPHLAHGLLGDQDRIPPRTIIVYDVHLLNVIDK
jgi:FKBP-type peptidyl-prolyl cis-trans isomerase FkpA